MCPDFFMYAFHHVYFFLYALSLKKGISCKINLLPCSVVVLSMQNYVTGKGLLMSFTLVFFFFLTLKSYISQFL